LVQSVHGAWRVDAFGGPVGGGGKNLKGRMKLAGGSTIKKKVKTDRQAILAIRGKTPEKGRARKDKPGRK